MKHSRLFTLSLAAITILASVIVAVSAGQAASASNGIYGGYVASSAWFDEMRKGAFSTSSNASWREANDKGLASGELSEVMLEVNFPGGNPFPRGRLPQLNIIGPDGKDIGAWPYAKSGTQSSAVFYLILKKGLKYRLQWFYPFGQKEFFGDMNIPTNSDSRQTYKINYTGGSASSDKKGGSSVTPRTGPEYSAPTTGPGYIPPNTGPGYIPPTTGPGYIPPNTK